MNSLASLGRLLTSAVVALAMSGTLLLVTSASATADDAVKRSQTRLNALGCQAGPADGRMGEWTRAAIMRFQSRHGNAATGRVTAAQSKLLFSNRAQRCDRRPVPARSGAGRRIVISQGQNWVWLVRANGSVAGQGGMIDNPSVLRKGSHRVGSYCGRTAKIRTNHSSGGLRLQNFVRFARCGVGFHRIPQRSSGAQIHADQLLGTNLRESHGCIRLSASMSRQVWDFGRVGTPVRVV